MQDKVKTEEWALTQAAFDSLISWLDADLVQAQEKYLTIRQGLVNYFRHYGCMSPENLADHTIVRVIAKVPQVASVYTGDPARYFLAVAGNVYREYARKSAPAVAFEDFFYTYEEQFDIRDKPKFPEQEFVALALFGNQIKPIALTADGSYRFLDEYDNLHSLIYVATAETIILRHAVEELESLVNDLRTREKDLQDFFERYPDFIINDNYKKAHPHVVLTKEDGDILIPDFVLEPLDQNSLCDLLELKLPTAQIFVMQKRRMRFSSCVFEACAQMRTYSEFFDEERNRGDIKDRYGLLAYKPRMFVIIGRRGTVSPIELRRMEADTPNIILSTYDDVILHAKARLKSLMK